MIICDDESYLWIVSLTRLSEFPKSERILEESFSVTAHLKGRKWKGSPLKQKFNEKLTIGTELSEYDAEHRAEHD